MSDSASLLRMLKGLQGRYAEKPPKGFKTRVQLQDEWKVSASNAKKFINLGLNSKMLTQVMVRIQTGNGLRNIPHYGRAKSK
jgi:hypothetical protein